MPSSRSRTISPRIEPNLNPWPDPAVARNTPGHCGWKSRRKSLLVERLYMQLSQPEGAPQLGKKPLRPAAGGDHDLWRAVRRVACAHLDFPARRFDARLLLGGKLDARLLAESAEGSRAVRGTEKAGLLLEKRA